jgi:hypothetical protein
MKDLPTHARPLGTFDKGAQRKEATTLEAVSPDLALYLTEEE